MLYHWLYPLSHDNPFFNVFKYITFRSFVGFLIATVASLIWGHFFIKYMKRKQFGQAIREDGPQTHLKKAGTPTMGGVFIIGAVFVAMIFCGHWLSGPVYAVMFVMVSYAFLGGLDDYLKISKKNSKGVSARFKLFWQFSTAALVGFYLINTGVIDTNLYLPSIKDPIMDLKGFYLIFVSLVIVGSSNAVNLTDGLDGLVTGPVILSCATLGFLAYAAGHAQFSQYLFIPHVEFAGELVVVLACVIGACLGFLWFNTYPAQIFMGDVGALSLGGVLGTVAVLTKNELLFVLIGGIFVLEAGSVILQVLSFKIRKKRIFKMAPIHHHFELLGWPETKVIVRFWIISAVLAILALATLKLR